MINGNNIFISLDGQQTPFAATTSNEIKVDIEKIPVSSPTTGDWEEHIVGRKRWGFTVNSLVTTLADIKQVLIVGNEYTITVYGRAGDTITPMLQGRARCLSARAGLTRGNLATGTFTFDGNGPLIAIVPVTSITLATEQDHLDVGGTTQITATILPENATKKDVRWLSNDQVATVDESGLVTAVGPGETYITCQATDGSLVFGEIKIYVTAAE